CLLVCPDNVRLGCGRQAVESRWAAAPSVHGGLSLNLAHELVIESRLPRDLKGSLFPHVS
ncbi:hypothetical protein RSAG8_01223, partial [Rhizoctonia solani AG-8 WAC10335]